jgi:hypothetical protein
VITVPPPPAVSGSTAELVALLVIVPEQTRAGYSRDLFEHWIDVDRDGCDTRCEVLEAELRHDLPGVAAGWYSIYDGRSTIDSGEFDVDHVVALGEAWRSGAATWDSDRRRDFANDLTEPDALIAVTASTNRSKSDQDPANWRPPDRASWCQFGLGWAHTKVRWGLTADQAEVDALLTMVSGC